MTRSGREARAGGTSEAGREPAAVETFDPEQVRPWRFHNRYGSGMDDASIEALALSIRRDGQQQPGLARRLPPGDTHVAEAVFGVRRLEACRRAGVRWRAEVRDVGFPDDRCASLVHAENEWTVGVSPLEDAVQWKALLDEGVFASQSALADHIGCHRARVSRGVRNATVLFDEEWLARLVRPAMHEFTVRGANRLGEELADPEARALARRRVRDLTPGTLSAGALANALCGATRAAAAETVYVRRKGGGATGPVTARIERESDGGWNVRVRPHEREPAELAELAEQVEALLAVETASAAGVRMGRRLTALLSADQAKDVPREWLEGCVWTAARWSGLDLDRWQSAAAADILRNQPAGWESAVVRAVGGRAADPAGAERRAPSGDLPETGGAKPGS